MRIREFVEFAFDRCTIPIKEPDRRDFFFGCYGFNLRSDNNGYIKSTAHFPAWPPDAFGFAASLMEQSGAYLHFDTEPDSNLFELNEIKRFLEESDFDALIGRTRLQSRISGKRGTDRFAVLGPNQFLLQLAGALWSASLTFLDLRQTKVMSVKFDQNNEVVRGPRDPSIDASTLISRDVAVSTEAFSVTHSHELTTAMATYCRARLPEICEFLSTRVIDRLKAKEIQNLCSRIAKRFLDKIKPIIESESNDALRREQLRAFLLTEFGVDSPFVDHLILNDSDFIRSIANGRLSEDDRDARLIALWATSFIQNTWRIIRQSDNNIDAGMDVETISSDIDVWSAVFRLLILADEAGKGFGFHKRRLSAPKERQYGRYCADIWKDELTVYLSLAAGTKHITPPRTMTRRLVSSLGAVVAKSRTSMLGCTIRSLSHNFALLPHHSRVRARWASSVPDPGEDPGEHFDDPQSRFHAVVGGDVLNLLLVPLPFRIDAEWFETRSSPKSGKLGRQNWGWFGIRANWLIPEELIGKPLSDITEDDRKSARSFEDKIVEFLCQLVKDAKSPVHGIVFPELSITEAILDKLWEQIVTSASGSALDTIRLVVCGVIDDPLSLRQTGARHGSNRVALKLRQAAPRSDKSWTVSAFRNKHHRWCMDERQIKRYGLSHVLNPTVSWWEDIQLGKRELHFAELTSGSLLSTLVCEDLARIEPCQVALRAVGPNLIIALLMDGVQVVERWPNMYAGVLADDPGSSVLSMTSTGLIRRAAQATGNTRASSGARLTFALWRDSVEGAREIDLPGGHHAQLITIHSEPVEELTIDGRSDHGSSAIRWRFCGASPVAAKQSSTSIPHTFQLP